MRKPFEYIAKISLIIKKSSDFTYEINKIAHSYGFVYENTIDDYPNNDFLTIEYLSKDELYENLVSRLLFFLKILKKENFDIFNYKINALIFDSKIHGELI